jgi:hypothetical protein
MIIVYDNRQTLTDSTDAREKDLRMKIGEKIRTKIKKETTT